MKSAHIVSKQPHQQKINNMHNAWSRHVQDGDLRAFSKPLTAERNEVLSFRNARSVVTATCGFAFSGGRWRSLGPISDNIEPTDHQHMLDPVRAARTNQLMSSNHKSDRKHRLLLQCDFFFLGLQVIDFGKNWKIQSCMAPASANLMPLLVTQPKQFSLSYKIFAVFYKIAYLLHYRTFYLLWLYKLISE